MTNIIGDHTIPKRSPSLYAIRRAVREHCDRDMGYIIGVSGGKDSLALVAACAAEELDVHAVIVNHNLQCDSAEFSAYAKSVVESMGVSAEVVDVEVSATGAGMECDARVKRYEALASFGKPILVGHTMNDQAETVVLGLLRGSGARSISGMSVYTPWGDTALVRPMVEDITTQQTYGACEELGITPWEDPHNDHTEFTRVKVRKEIIPTLDDVRGGGMVQALCTTAGNVRELEEYVWCCINEMYPTLWGEEDHAVDAALVRGMLPVEQKMVITEFLRRNCGEVKRSYVDAIVSIVMKNHGGKKTHVPGGTVMLDRGVIRFLAGHPDSSSRTSP